MNTPIFSIPFDPRITDHTVEVNRNIPINYQRQSYGYSEDEQGNSVIVGNHTYRWKEHTNGKFYLVMEPSTTNLITDTSEDFAKWTKDSNTVVYSRTQIGPSGKYDADEIQFSSSANTGIVSSGMGDRHSQTLTFSVWMKVASSTASIELRLASNNTYASGAKTVTTSWQRFSFTATLVGGDTNSLGARINVTNTNAPIVQVFGAQVEAKSAATSYFPTTPQFLTNKNLVIDGDMELENVSNWTNFGTVTSVQKSSSIVRFGKQSLNVVTGAAASGVQQTIPSVNGATYLVSAWIYQTTAFDVNVVLNSASGGPSVSSTGVWTYVEQTYKAASTSFTVQIVANGGAGTFYVDRLRIIQQSCPESSFETSFTTSPPSPWTTNGGPTVAKETVNKNSGSAAIKLTCATQGAGLKITQTDLALSNNTWYQITAWIYIVSQSLSTVIPVISGHANYNITNAPAKSVIGSYQKVSAIFKTGTLAGSDDLDIVQNIAGNVVFIVDDVSIVALDAPIVTRLQETITLPFTNPQSSNLLQYSEDFTQAAWVKNGGVVVTGSSATAPDGSQTASAILFPATVAVMTQVASGFIQGASYTASIWLRRKNSNDAGLIFFSMSDGVSDVAGQIVSVTNKWRRYVITGTISVSATTLFMLIHTEVPLPEIEVYAWGAQLEQSSSVSRYTGTTSTSRAPVFTNFASRNYVKHQGSISFFCVLQNIGIASTNLFGDTNTNALNLEVDGSATNIICRIRAITAAGALTNKINNIATVASVSTTAEHHVVVTWSVEKDSNGKVILLRTRCFLDGALVVDQTYTDIRKWTYDQTAFTIANNNVTNSMIRDLKIWTAPLTPDEVNALYVAG